MKTITNNPSIAGSLASKKTIFGENSQYAIAAVHTRFDSVCFFVWDAEKSDELGMATVIRQEPTYELAMAGIN